MGFLKGIFKDAKNTLSCAGSYFFKTLKSLLDEVPTFKAFTEESGILKKPNYEKETAKNMAKISQGLDKLNESIKDLSKNI